MSLAGYSRLPSDQLLGSVTLFFSSLIFAESNVGLLYIIMLVFGLVGVYLLFMGLHELLVKETIVIDKKTSKRSYHRGVFYKVS